MAQFAESFPYLLFAVLYLVLKVDIVVATTVLLASTFLSTAFLWYKHRTLTVMQWTVFVMTIIFCTLTLLLRDERFLQWKVSVINLLLSGVFFVGHFWQKTPAEHMLGAHLPLPAHIWRRLNIAWASFFMFIALLNTALIYTLTFDHWVLFKSIGTLGLSVVFMIGIFSYIYPYIKESMDTKEENSHVPPKDK